MIIFKKNKWTTEQENLPVFLENKIKSEQLKDEIFPQFLKNNKKNVQQLRSHFFPIFRAKNKKYIFDVKR